MSIENRAYQACHCTIPLMSPNACAWCVNNPNRRSAVTWYVETYELPEDESITDRIEDLKKQIEDLKKMIGEKSK